MDDLSPTAILLLSCPDQKGVVAAVSEFIFRHGGNVVHADQHNDPQERIFSQRVEFELIGFSLNRGDIGPAFAPLADRFQMRWSLGFSDDRTRMAILVSELWTLPLRPARSMASGRAVHFNTAGHQQPQRPEASDTRLRCAIPLLDSVTVDMATISGAPWQDDSSSDSSSKRNQIFDPNLAVVVNAWTTLPESVKALVKSDTVDD